MADRKILVTGGCGFVGVNLVRRIAERWGAGTEIRVLDNETTGTPRDLPPVPLTYHRGDVRDPAAVASAVHGCDVVVHLAAHPGVLASIRDPLLNFDVNVQGTLNVLLAARDAGVSRLVLASTGGAILGDVEPPVHEEMLPKPISPYGASKLAAEGYAHAFAQCYDMKIATLRFANVYGPHSGAKGSAVAQFCRKILAGDAITVHGDGSQVRDFVFVEDICDGILQAVELDASGVFQLGTGTPTSISTLLEHLRQVVGAPWPVEVRHVAALRGEVKFTYCDISKARRALRYDPRVALPEGLARTWQWFVQDRARAQGAVASSAS